MNQTEFDKFLIDNVKCVSVQFHDKIMIVELSLSDDEPLLRIETVKSKHNLCSPISIYLIDEKSLMAQLLLEFITSSYSHGYCFNCLIQNWSEGQYLKDTKKKIDNQKINRYIF